MKKPLTSFKKRIKYLSIATSLCLSSLSMDVYGHYTLENLKSSAKITEQTSHNRNMNCYNRAKKLLVTININKADNKTLCQLPGIGHKKASAIIAYRQQHGKFKSVKDLLNIKGVNDKLIDKLKPHIVLTP